MGYQKAGAATGVAVALGSGTMFADDVVRMGARSASSVLDDGALVGARALDDAVPVRGLPVGAIDDAAQFGDDALRGVAGADPLSGSQGAQVMRWGPPVRVRAALVRAPMHEPGQPRILDTVLEEGVQLSIDAASELGEEAVFDERPRLIEAPFDELGPRLATIDGPIAAVLVEYRDAIEVTAVHYRCADYRMRCVVLACSEGDEPCLARARQAWSDVTPGSFAAAVEQLTDELEP